SWVSDCVQVQKFFVRERATLAQTEKSGGSDHRGVVGAVFHFGEERSDRKTVFLPLRLKTPAEARVRGNTTDDREGLAAMFFGRKIDLRKKCVDDRFLNGGAKIGKALFENSFFAKFFSSQ